MFCVCVCVCVVLGKKTMLWEKEGKGAETDAKVHCVCVTWYPGLEAMKIRRDRNECTLRL
jgi:hypothetical protein